MGIATSIFGAALSTLSALKSYLGGDEHANWEPVHSDTYDFDAVDWNTVVAGLSEVALRTRIGNIVVLNFSHPNVTASQTDASFYRNSGGDTALLRAVSPWAGSIVGLAVRVENARTAGTMTVNWRYGTTKGTLAAVIDGTNTQIRYVTQLPGTEAIAAGAELNVVFTTDGSWAAGATPSVTVDLYVAMGS